MKTGEIYDNSVVLSAEHLNSCSLFLIALSKFVFDKIYHGYKTLESDLEHMLITMARQSGEEGLVIDNSLAEQLLRKIVQTNEELSADGKQSVMVVSPAIRRVFSHVIRQHIDDQIVLAFTELPETRKIEVVATISNADQSA